MPVKDKIGAERYVIDGDGNRVLSFDHMRVPNRQLPKSYGPNTTGTPVIVSDVAGPDILGHKFRTFVPKSRMLGRNSLLNQNYRVLADADDDYDLMTAKEYSCRRANHNHYNHDLGIDENKPVDDTIVKSTHAQKIRHQIHGKYAGSSFFHIKTPFTEAHFGK